MDLKLKGKRALVTGGSKGIGWASACALADEGCEVMIAARNAPAGGRFKFRATDLSQRGAAEALAEWAGELEILVNNAGAIPGGDLLRVDEETWRRAWDLKMFGYINLTRQAYARMKARKAGVIVNILGNAGEKLDASYIAGSTANATPEPAIRRPSASNSSSGRHEYLLPWPIATRPPQPRRSVRSQTWKMSMSWVV